MDVVVSGMVTSNSFTSSGSNDWLKVKTTHLRHTCPCPKMGSSSYSLEHIFANPNPEIGNGE